MIVINQRRLVRGFVYFSIFLLCFSLAVLFVNRLVDRDYPFDEILSILSDIDGEFGFSSWFSTVILLFCSALLAAIAFDKAEADDPYLKYWKYLAILFLYLSMDDALDIHALLTGGFRTALNARGLLYNAWIVPASIVLLVFALVYVPFLRNLPPETRRAFLVSATVFLGAAVGMEAVGGYAAERWGLNSLAYILLNSFEEFIELLGMTLFASGLLTYIRRYTNVRVRFADE